MGGWGGEVRLSTSRDQLMAADDGAERGQGSKPCIVSLATLSHGVPSLSCLSLSSIHPSPAASCTFTYIYQHSASPWLVGLRGCALPAGYAAVCAAAARAFVAAPIFYAFHIVLRRQCMTHTCMCMKCDCGVCTNGLLEKKCVCVGQDGPTPIPHPSLTTTLLTLRPPSYPPPPHTHTSPTLPV